MRFLRQSSHDINQQTTVTTGANSTDIAILQMHCDICHNLAIVTASLTKLECQLGGRSRQVLCECGFDVSTGYYERVHSPLALVTQLETPFFSHHLAVMAAR